ncbi:MAG TPA: FliH/SctL family protein, partial [bacterium]|nr:FliH/SctL family protein [bacterium]
HAEAKRISLSNRSKVLKDTLLHPQPVLVGERSVERLPDGMFSREDLLRQAQATLQQAQKEKQTILSNALAEKERILNQARLERDEIQRRAYEEGYEKGLQEGLNKGTQQGRQEVLKVQKPIGDRLQGIVDAAEQAFSRVCTECEHDMIELIISVAEKVIHQQIDQSNEIVLNMVRETIARSADKREVLLRVNPDDVELVREHQEVLSAEFDDMRVLRLEPDPRITRGGCLLETSSGCVDGRVEAQLAETRKAFRPHPLKTHADV